MSDPGADNSRAAAWAPSDESTKSSWQSYSYRAIVGFPGNTQPTTWNDFILGLLGVGECLIDDLTVHYSPSTFPLQMVANGDFERGSEGWRMLGTHNCSRVVPDPADPANHVLHLIASGAQEHMHNHIEATLIDGRRVVNGGEYQISYRAKWLAGNNLLNTRLYFNRAARTTALARPMLNGTPSARNSRSVANLGPTFSRLHQLPVVPVPGQAVKVSIAIQDPHGIAASELYWAVNGGQLNRTLITRQSDGRYSGTISGQASGALVHFYVWAMDGRGSSATHPLAGPDSGALLAVVDGREDFSQSRPKGSVLGIDNSRLANPIGGAWCAGIKSKMPRPSFQKISSPVSILDDCITLLPQPKWCA